MPFSHMPFSPCQVFFVKFLIFFRNRVYNKNSVSIADIILSVSHDYKDHCIIIGNMFI